ncbi:MAG: hypothetical protein LBE82_10325 [Chitinophagaceae bacterium]|nr:hypothetical protein [Chitinophagaceae bacterium]
MALNNKFLKRVLIGTGIIFLLPVILLVIAEIYIRNNEQQIIQKVTEKLKENLHSSIAVEGLKVNIWKSFPNIRVSIEGLNISDSVYHKPLIRAESISTSISLLQLIKKKISIQTLYVSNGAFNLFTDSTGYSNSYILSQKNNKENDKKKNADIDIKSINFENFEVRIQADDRHKDYHFLLKNAYTEIAKSVNNYNILFSEKILINGLGFNIKNGYFLNNKTLEAAWELHLITDSAKLFFDETAVKIDNYPYKIKGAFYFSDDTAKARFDIKVQTPQNEYKELSSLVAENIQKSLELVQLENPIDVTASISGLFTQPDPEVYVTAIAADNKIGLPPVIFDSAGFNAVFFNRVNAALPPSDANSEITISNFKGNWNGIILTDNKIRLVDLDSPHLFLNMASECNLSNLNDKFDLNSFSLTDGKVNLQLNYSGFISSAEKVLENLSGELNIRNAHAVYIPRNILLSNCSGDIVFDEKNLFVKNLQTDINKEHFTINVSAKNIGNAALHREEKAIVNCNVTANTINLNSFISLLEPSSASVQKSSPKQKIASNTFDIDDLLQKGNLSLDIRADKIRYQKFEGENFAGSILMMPDYWLLRKLSLQHADGSLSIKGKLNNIASKTHRTYIQYTAQKLDIQKLFYGFNNFGMTGLTSKNIRGTFTSTGNLSFLLGGTGKLIPHTTNGGIDFSIKKGSLINFAPLLNIQQYVFKNRGLNNIAFDEIRNKITLDKGDIFIPRMKIGSSAFLMYVQGIYSLKNNTDISIQVPLSNLQAPTEEKMQKAGEKNTGAKRSSSVYLRATGNADGSVKIGLDIFKKFRKSNMEERFRKKFGENDD